MREWVNKRIKDLLTFCSGDTLTSDMLSEEGKYPVYGGNGIRGQYHQFNREGNYILVGRVGALCGNIHNVYGRFWATEHALIGTPIENFDSRWLAYMLQDMNLGQHSIASAQPVLSITKIARLELPFPSYATQRAIADYLDKECGKIGKKIELLERKADAYKRLRRSIINRAVTRGLNPDVPLKPSKIPWVGEIPEHWEVLRIKSLYEERVELSETGTEDLLSVSEYYGVARRADKVDSENLSRSDSLVGYKLCFERDVVSNIMLAWKGSLGTTPYDGIVSPAYGVYKPIVKLNSLYFHYLFRTEIFKGIFRCNSRGIIESRLRLYTPNFLAIHTLFPPLSEQNEIVSYLDEKCGKIDAIVAKIEKQIERLKELKRSLINEVVTGQRAI